MNVVSKNGSSTKLPLVVDLDGTLIRTDSLFELALQILRRDLKALSSLLVWLLRGRVAFKQAIAERAQIDVEGLPFQEDFIAWLEEQHAIGHRIILATAADRRVAEQIATRFPFIDEILATDGDTNLKGRAKGVVLRERFPGGFIYAGDSSADVEVWRHSAEIVVVGASQTVERRARAIRDPIAIFPRGRLTPTIFRRALRLHQWAKNALVFIPLVLGGKFHDAAAWLHAFSGFVALSVLASATYLINDLWDLAEDRRHWSKRYRPLAAGQVSIGLAISLAGIGLVSSFALIFWSGPTAAQVLGGYLALSLAYSFRFKREPIVDVLAITSLFTMRLGLGVAVTGVRFSPWLFVFSMFVFLSLSLAKRFTEVGRMAEHGHSGALGRGYKASDGPLVLALGVAAMVAAVLIMVIYLISDAFPAGFYSHPVFLWVFPLILFLWFGRVWLLCYRGELHDDPVAFALKDQTSVFYGAMMVVAFAAAVL